MGLKKKFELAKKDHDKGKYRRKQVKRNREDDD